MREYSDGCSSGLPIELFDQRRAAALADRSQFVKEHIGATFFPAMFATPPVQPDSRRRFVTAGSPIGIQCAGAAT